MQYEHAKASCAVRSFPLSIGFLLIRINYLNIERLARATFRAFDNSGGHGPGIHVVAAMLVAASLAHVNMNKFGIFSIHRLSEPPSHDATMTVRQ